MPWDEEEHESPQDESIPPDEEDVDLPEVEDSYEADTQPAPPAPEDEPDSLEVSPHTLDPDESLGAHVEEVPQNIEEFGSRSIDRDDESDAAVILESEPDQEAAEASTETGWSNAQEAYDISVELKRIEEEVREILGERDPKRKRKLAGSRRWLELEEDIRSLHYTGRFSEEELTRLTQLVHKRHYLFRRLKFLAGTRPTWNT